jgi:ADP-ribosyl-[dinitrogen reductase] hydrolase
MRIAPLAFLLNPTDPQDRTTIRDVCRITHHSDEAYGGALAVMLAIRSVLSRTWSRDRNFLAASVDSLPDSAVREWIKELLPLKLPASGVARNGATGHVVDTVPLALYCAQLIDLEPFPTVIARTISAGGDTHTTASIAVQLAWTVVGSAGIPHDLLAEVSGVDELRAIAEDFAELVVMVNPQTTQMDS